MHYSSIQTEKGQEKIFENLGSQDGFPIWVIILQMIGFQKATFLSKNFAMWFLPVAIRWYLKKRSRKISSHLSKVAAVKKLFQVPASEDDNSGSVTSCSASPLDFKMDLSCFDSKCLAPVRFWTSCSCILASLSLSACSFFSWKLQQAVSTEKMSFTLAFPKTEGRQQQLFDHTLRKKTTTHTSSLRLRFLLFCPWIICAETS